MSSHSVERSRINNQYQQTSHHNNTTISSSSDNTNNTNNCKNNNQQLQHKSTIFSKLLQPSSTPSSVTKQQLELFQGITKRRSQQLHSFSLATHQKLYKSLTANTQSTTSSATSTADTTKTTTDSTDSKEPITSNEITTLFTKLPSKKPTNDTHQYTSLILYLLTENFHKSCDSTQSASDRRYCLNKLKFILYQIEFAFCTWHTQEEKERRIEEELKKEKRDTLIRERATKEREQLIIAEKRKQQQQQQQQQIEQQKQQQIEQQKQQQIEPQQQVEQQQQQQQQKQSSNNSDMGSLVSKFDNNNNNNESLPSKGPQEVIILDDDDDDDDDTRNQSQYQQENNQQSSSTATNINTNTDTKQSSNQHQQQQQKQAPRNSNKCKSPSQYPSLTRIPRPSDIVLSSKIPPSQNYIPVYKRKPREYTLLPKVKPTNQSLLFLKDSTLSSNNNVKYTSSYSIYERALCQVHINNTFMSCQETIETIKKLPIPLPFNYPKDKIQSSIYLDGKALDDFQERLQKWDPFWNVICDCSIFDIKTTSGEILNQCGYKTTYITHTEYGTKSLNKDSNSEVLSACMFPLQIKNLFPSHGNIGINPLADVEWGQKPIQHRTSLSSVQYVNNEKRLLVRTLPLVPNPKYKTLRSDTHQWPKGTFAQLESRILNPMQQRKQQHHDPASWKGLSNIMDITEFLDVSSFSQEQKFSLCSKDSELYGIQVALCEYTTPDKLYDICMSSGGKGSIAKMDYHDGLKHAMKYFEKEMLVLDDSDNDDDGNSDIKSNERGTIESVTCSLICPVTMQVINTPVRGRFCKHINCFDLRTFLHSNSKVSGGRWRCFVCEDFIAVDELVYDGFIAQVLETFSNDIDSTSRDKMQLFSDGTWKLVDETSSSSMKRNQKKRRKLEQRHVASMGSDLDGNQTNTEVIDIE